MTDRNGCPKSNKPQISRTRAIREPLFPEVWQANRNGLPNGEMILYVDSTDDESQETGGSRKTVESKAKDLDIVRCAHGVVCERDCRRWRDVVGAIQWEATAIAADVVVWSECSVERS
jgi:hypothetical protein